MAGTSEMPDNPFIESQMDAAFNDPHATVVIVDHNPNYEYTLFENASRKDLAVGNAMTRADAETMGYEEGDNAA